MPEWIVEIVSSLSRRMDYYKKLFKYHTAGIREYWIVDPDRKRIIVYNFQKETACTKNISFQFFVQAGTTLYPYNNDTLTM